MVLENDFRIIENIQTRLKNNDHQTYFQSTSIQAKIQLSKKSRFVQF